MAHWIDKSCTKCGACLFECPTGSIVEGREIYVIDADTCKDHRSCVMVCPVDAIHLRDRAPAPGQGGANQQPQKPRPGR
ncbi:MAG: 4Fe-4S binding protein [Bdellovibrionales bacterium]|nr:4Fe-4S binding protein [Bdellovibrionales bacterium]